MLIYSLRFRPGNIPSLGLNAEVPWEPEERATAAWGTLMREPIVAANLVCRLLLEKKNRFG